MQGGDKSIGEKDWRAVRWSLLALHLCLAIHLCVRVHPIAGVVLLALAVTHLPLESRLMRRMALAFVCIMSILPLLACAMAIYWLIDQQLDRDNIPTIICVIAVVIANLFAAIFQAVPESTVPGISAKP